jgi:hypothetical protein
VQWGADETAYLRAAPRHPTLLPPGIADLTPSRPARLLDVIEGRSGTVLAGRPGPDWRAGIATASLDPSRGYATALNSQLPGAVHAGASGLSRSRRWCMGPFGTRRSFPTRTRTYLLPVKKSVPQPRSSTLATWSRPRSKSTAERYHQSNLEPPGVDAAVSRGPDARATTSCDAAFTAIGIRVIKTPVRAPRANGIAERFVGSVRRELLDGIPTISSDTPQPC